MPLTLHMDPNPEMGMNATLTPDPQTLQLVDIIDFKWLMSAAGYHVHVERLQSDPDYAERCLTQAETAPDQALRVAVARLRTLLPARSVS